MKAAVLLVTLLCLNVAFSYGPVFILKKEGEIREEKYLTSKYSSEEINSMADPNEENLLHVHIYPKTDETVGDLMEYVNAFNRTIILPNIVESINGTSVQDVHSVKDVEEIVVGNKTLILQYKMTEIIPTNKTTICEETKRGVPMNNGMLVALIIFFSLSISLYYAVMCINDIQTPTTYTDKNVPVGKEY